MNWTAERLQNIADAVWAECLQFLKPDCCIIATRVFIDTLAALGERNTFGLSVTAMLFGQSLTRHAHEHGCGFGVLGCEARPEGSGMVVLGADPEQVRRPNALEEIWSGHLVAVVQRRWVVDVSVAQATQHPEIGLVEDGPLVMPTNEAFLRGRGTAELVTHNGSRFYYEANTGASGGDWKTSTDWTWPMMAEPLTQATLARLNGKPYEYPEWMRWSRAFVGPV